MSRVAFGTYRLDLTERMLYLGAQPVALRPKLVETLAVLVREAPRVVPREHLVAEVWPDTHVVDSSVSRNISELRAVLAEGFGDAEVVQTVPRRGYRFVADVEREALDAVPAPRPKGGRRRWAVGAVAAVLVLLGVLQGRMWTLDAGSAVGADADARLERARRDLRAGYDYYGKWTPDDMTRALGLFRSAAVTYPEGWLGQWGILRGTMAHSLILGTSFTPWRAEMLAAVDQLERVGGDVPVVQPTLGMYALLARWDWAEAELRIERGIELRASHDLAYERRAQLRVLQGRFASAERDFLLALELAPQYDSRRLGLAWAKSCAGDVDAAIAVIQDFLDDPSDRHKEDQAYRLLVGLYGRKGDFADARAALERTVLPQADLLNLQAWLAALEGDSGEARALVERLEELCARHGMEYCDTALAYTALGNHEMALDSLESGVRARHWKVLTLAVDPRLDGLHRSARWGAILKEIGAGGERLTGRPVEDRDLKSGISRLPGRPAG